MKSPKYRKLFEEKLKTFCQNCGIERKNYQKIIYQDLYYKYAPPNLVGTSSNSALLPAKNDNNLLKDEILFKDCRSASPVREYFNGIHKIDGLFLNFQNFQSTLSNFIDNDNTNLVENEGGETNAKQTTLPTVPNLFANRKYVVFSKLQHTEFLMKKGVAYHIIIKGCEYDKVKELLNKIFLANPNNTLVYDIGEKNIDSKTHTLSMKSNFFYESIRKLNLTDSAEIVKIIGDYFMAHNRSLTKLAFTFPKLQEIGNSFLYYNRTKLIEFTLMAPSVKKIQGHFMTTCSKLKNFSLMVPKLEEIETCFMYNCESLGDFSFVAPMVTSIGDHFMEKFTKLTELILIAPRLEIIRSRFMEKCVSLTDCTFKVPYLKKIGNYFLMGCTNLKDLTFTAPSLKQIKWNFMENCTNLETFTLEAPKLNEVGPNFMIHSTHLKKVTLKIPKELIHQIPILKNK